MNSEQLLCRHQSCDRLLVHTNMIQPLEKPAIEVHPGNRLIFHNSFQQSNFFRWSVRLELLLEQTPSLEPFLFLRMMSDTTQSLAALQSSQSRRDTSDYDLFSCRLSLVQDRLTHVCRLFQKSNMSAKSSKTLDSPFHSFGHPMRQFSKSELRLNRHCDRHVSFARSRHLLRSRSCVFSKHQHKGVGLIPLSRMIHERDLPILDETAE